MHRWADLKGKLARFGDIARADEDVMAQSLPLASEDPGHSTRADNGNLHARFSRLSGLIGSIHKRELGANSGEVEEQHQQSRRHHRTGGNIGPSATLKVGTFDIQGRPPVESSTDQNEQQLNRTRYIWQLPEAQA